MPQALSVALCQLDLHWENPAANLQKLAEHFATLSGADLIVLPEMFSTGFSMQPEKFASQSANTLQWMITQAKKQKAAIYGSLMVVDEGKYYNRGYFVYPEGHYEYYDKRHLFSLAGEEKVYTAGAEKKTVEYKGWRINLQICYDLRFPVWARNVEDYDVLIYVANWPKPRIAAWTALLKARAIENMSYCIGVNRVGVDGVNCQYTGHSAIYDVLGTKMSNILPNIEQTEIVTLDKKHIKAYRNTFKFLNDRDAFTF